MGMIIVDLQFIYWQLYAVRCQSVSDVGRIVVSEYLILSIHFGYNYSPHLFPAMHKGT